MPLYAVDFAKLAHLKAEPFPRPSGRLLDANGKWIPYVFRADMESGRVDRYDVDLDGVWGMDLAGHAVLLSETYPAPLVYVKRNPHGKPDATDVVGLQTPIDSSGAGGMETGADQLGTGAGDDGSGVIGRE